MRSSALTLDDEVRPQDAHRSDANARLGGPVRGTKACEHDGASAAHGAEERLYKVHVVSYRTLRESRVGMMGKLRSWCTRARGQLDVFGGDLDRENASEELTA